MPHSCAQTMLYTWDQYYWAANVLLAELTDGGTFHERAQFFLQQWVCGYNKLARAMQPCMRSQQPHMQHYVAVHAFEQPLLVARDCRAYSQHSCLTGGIAMLRTHAVHASPAP